MSYNERTRSIVKAFEPKLDGANKPSAPHFIANDGTRFEMSNMPEWFAVNPQNGHVEALRQVIELIERHREYPWVDEDVLFGALVTSAKSAAYQSGLPPFDVEGLKAELGVAYARWRSCHE